NILLVTREIDILNATNSRIHHQYGDKPSACHHRVFDAPLKSKYQPLSSIPKRMHLSFINDKSPSRIIKTKQGCEIKLKRMTESEKYIRKSATRPTISSLLRPNRMVEIGKCNLVLVPSERYLINGKVDGGLNEQQKLKVVFAAGNRLENNYCNK
ncbi:1070_t:CDS:2, partial [Dentiscutata heterogama]